MDNECERDTWHNTVSAITRKLDQDWLARAQEYERSVRDARVKDLMNAKAIEEMRFVLRTALGALERCLMNEQMPVRNGDEGVNSRSRDCLNDHGSDYRQKGDAAEQRYPQSCR